MKRNLLLFMILPLSLLITAFPVRGGEPFPADGLLLLSEGSLKELGWEVEVDPRADTAVTEIANLLNPAPDQPGKGVVIVVWDLDSVGVTDSRQARVAGIVQVLYHYASAREAQRACEALPHRLMRQLQEAAGEVRLLPLSIARGRGHLLAVRGSSDVYSLWLAGCRGSAVTVLWIVSLNPQLPSELMPHLQSMVLGE
ncbi:hypothetical protein [Thermoflexus sp.]|uniref:hypothetical protein n=1 Tax=Thermoflexus sp. TaxID=1969742 RepID=UPI002600B8C0|nr:hypothetical protein [Thermoflexus sp.]MCS6963717.1 hypothetical protein [Thermoflexus sp.]MCX7690219.1 hypothetical protein [Thermoflexus sp.]MDW8185028.1 hypothetical protein [Anaerolineae bacterium]